MVLESSGEAAVTMMMKLLKVLWETGLVTLDQMNRVRAWLAGVGSPEEKPLLAEQYVQDWSPSEPWGPAAALGTGTAPPRPSPVWPKGLWALAAAHTSSPLPRHCLGSVGRGEGSGMPACVGGCCLRALGPDHLIAPVHQLPPHSPRGLSAQQSFANVCSRNQNGAGCKRGPNAACLCQPACSPQFSFLWPVPSVCLFFLLSTVVF